jgi:hypothetical protein
MESITLDYDAAIWVLEIYSTTDPDMQAGAYLFNFFFSQMIFFALIGIIIKMIVRVLTRS